ncbi:hypothetical protein [Vibrio alginolyticus]|uniref:hypothetical protein n=1 Tax=Vibrio alginolyticus TaxID=663 RepID=UPI003B67ECD5
MAGPNLSIEELNSIKSHPIKFGHQFPFLSSIPSSLVTELSYFEEYSEDGGVGCLSVNGFGDVYQPVTVSLQFLMKEQIWKVKHVKIDERRAFRNSEIDGYGSIQKSPAH